jgi:hypothetical protein
MPSEKRAARRAEQAAIFERERQRTAARELRERADTSGYTMDDNYGVRANGDGTVTVGIANADDSVTMPFAGAHAAIETPADARSRVTATRVAAFGILALAVPKNDRRLFLVITSGSIEAVNVVDGSDSGHLRKWVAAFNTQAASLTG